MNREEALSLVGHPVRQIHKAPGIGRMFNIVRLVGVVGDDEAVIAPSNHGKVEVVPLRTLRRSVKHSGHPNSAEPIARRP